MADDLLQELDLAGVVQQKSSPMVELGATGLKRTTGYLNEEFLPALKGRKAVQIYREMSDNDPIIGGLLFAIDRLIRQVDWSVEPASQSPEDKEIAEFVESCMDDMSLSWDDFISEVLTMLPYGWSYHEIVYKKRVGPWEKDAKNRSQHDDGRIGWRKMPIRSQETLQRWVFDEKGGIKGMVQIAPPLYQMVYLPIEKCLLFRTSTVKNSPEGKSILRNSYRPWFYKKRLEEIEGIGVERDLAGLPVGKVPHDYLSAKPGTDKAKMVEAFKKMVRSVRRDEQEGVVVPVAYDQDTKQPLFEFELLNSGGSRSFDTNAIIQRYEQRMLMTVLADFILVGHEGSGSYSMHLDKTGMFRAAIDSFVKAIENVLNDHAIPRLLSVNGMQPRELPKFKAGAVDQPNLTELASFMGAMTQAGVQFFPDAEIEKFIRKISGLPELDENKEKMLEVEQRQADVMRLAQQKMGLLGMQQEAEQRALANQQQADQMGMQNEQMDMQRQQFANQPDPREEAEFQRQMQLEQHQMGMQQQAEQHEMGMQQKMDEQAMAASQKQQEMDYNAAQKEQEMQYGAAQREQEGAQRESDMALAEEQKISEMQLQLAQRQLELDQQRAQKDQELAYSEKQKKQDLTWSERERRQALVNDEKSKKQEAAFTDKQRKGELSHAEKTRVLELKHKQGMAKLALKPVPKKGGKNDSSSKKQR